MYLIRMSLLAAISITPCTWAASKITTNTAGDRVWLERQASAVATGVVAIIREADGSLRFSAPARSFEDYSADGSVAAASSISFDKTCGSAGSTCILAASCAASYTVGPGLYQTTQSAHATLRLSRDASLVWIETRGICSGLPAARPPMRHGLYRTADLAPVFEATFSLASPFPGRRSITKSGAVLLQHPEGGFLLASDSVRRRIAADVRVGEAVMPDEARMLVYAATTGELRKIDLGLNRESSFGIAGEQLALSDSGDRLVFFTRDQRLAVLDTAIGSVRFLPMPDRKPVALALSGNGRYVFLLTETNQLRRYDLDNGSQEEWIAALPEVMQSSVRFTHAYCPLVCYSSERIWELAPSAIVVLYGAGLDQPGLTMVFDQTPVPLQQISNTQAWFQVPSQLRAPRPSKLRIQTPHPSPVLAFENQFQTVPSSISCLGVLHQAFDRPVTAQDPAKPGNIIHVFLTGLPGVETFPDGQPNPVDRLIGIADPPELWSKDPYEVLFFGLAPGLIGMQQLDLRATPRVQPMEILFAVAAGNCRLP